MCIYDKASFHFYFIFWGMVSAYDILKLVILLPLTLECWNYTCEGQQQPKNAAEQC